MEEIIVDPHTGRWYTVGTNGPEFTNVPKDAIIFNHIQTDQLLNRGKTASRAKAYGGAFASGNAYVSSGSFGLAGLQQISNTLRGQGSESHAAEAAESAAEAATSAASAASSASKASSSASSAANSTAEAAEKFEETLDWIETKIDRIERIAANFERTATNAFNDFSKRTTALSNQMEVVSNEIGIQAQAANRYLQQANSVGLSEAYAAKVRDGTIDIELITDEELNEKISEYKEWYEKYLDARDASEQALVDFQDLVHSAVELITTRYDAWIGNLEDQNNLISAQIDLLEEQGYVAGAEYYEKMAEREQEIIKQLKKQYSEYEWEFNHQQEIGVLDKNSEEYYELLSNMDEVSQSILESEKNLAEYANSIRQIYWDAFDGMQDKLEDLNSEAEFFIGLFDSEKLFDETGAITEYGEAVMALHVQEYNTYMKQADAYAAELQEIQKDLAEDPNNQKLLERREELTEAQRDAISAAQDEKEALRDLVEEGIQAELDSLDELIDKYKEKLDIQRESYDYQKDIEEQAQEIANIEKQLAAYAGDNSEEGMRKRQELTNQLTEARENLEETQFDKYIEETQSNLEELYEQYEEILNKRLDNLDALVSGVIDSVNANASSIVGTIQEQANKVGYTISEEMSDIWDGGSGSGVTFSNYNKTFTEKTTEITSALNAIKEMIAKQYGIPASGIKGYASGTRKVGKSGLYWTNENAPEAIVRPSDGAILTKLSSRDMVLPAKATQNFWDMMQNPAEFFSGLKDQSNRLVTTTTDVQNDITLNMNLTLPNVKNYDEFVSQLKRDPNMEKFIQEITLGRMDGHGRLRKYTV